MSSSPTYTFVDQFDEDEFPDVTLAPAALVAALKTVPDPRDPRGRRHGLAGILALAACAVMAGARSFVAIAEWAAAAAPAALARLGVTGDAPSESTIRRTLSRVDGNGLDDIIGDSRRGTNLGSGTVASGHDPGVGPRDGGSVGSAHRAVRDRRRRG